MWGSLKASAACAASALTFALLLFGWAASQSRGAAHFLAGGGRGADSAFSLGSPGPLDSEGKAQSRNASGQSARLPSPVGFREDGGRGLLVRAWVNGAGPFNFAVDTGAGATVLSPRVAGEARVEVEAGGRGVEVGGLSGVASRSARPITRSPRAASQSSRPACRGTLTAYSTRPKPSRRSATSLTSHAES